MRKNIVNPCWQVKGCVVNQLVVNFLPAPDGKAAHHLDQPRRSWVQLARCEYQSAIVENEMTIKLNPTYAAAHCGLADSLAFEGKYNEAVVGFEKALDLSPNDPQRWAF